MDYDAFEQQYNQTQIDRIKASLEQIRQAEAAPGRVIPDENTLVIGDGRNSAWPYVFRCLRILFAAIRNGGGAELDDESA